MNDVEVGVGVLWEQGHQHFMRNRFGRVHPRIGPVTGAHKLRDCFISAIERKAVPFVSASQEYLV